MKSFLKSSRKTGSKKYLGFIGSHLIEILDDEPVIMQLLKDSAFSYSPSQESRYSGPEKRLILTTFLADALLIFKTTKENAFGDVVELSVFVNNSVTVSATLLKEAEQLAALRWPAATLRFKNSSQEKNHLFLQAGWAPEPDQDEVFIKYIGPG